MVDAGFWGALANFGVPAILAGALIVIVDRRLVGMCVKLGVIMERLERVIALIERREGGERRV